MDKTCSECGGPKRGRGFTHKSGCSKASHAGAGKTSGAAGSVGRGIDYRRLKGLDVEELMEIRDSVDAMIQDKAPELKARIAALQAKLKAIKG